MYFRHMSGGIYIECALLLLVPPLLFVIVSFLSIFTNIYIYCEPLFSLCWWKMGGGGVYYTEKCIEDVQKEPKSLNIAYQ